MEKGRSFQWKPEPLLLDYRGSALENPFFRFPLKYARVLCNSSSQSKALSNIVSMGCLVEGRAQIEVV